MYIGAPFKPGTSQIVAYTDTAGTIANAIAGGVQVVRVWCSTAAYISIGASPTAVATDIPVPANTPEYFIAPPGSKVSALRVADNGNLHVTEMSR